LIPLFIIEDYRLDEPAEALELILGARRDIVIGLLRSILAGKQSLPYRIGFS